MDQLGLPIIDRVRQSLETAAAEIRAECRAIAKRTKQGDVLARTVGMDPGNLSKALRGDTYKLDLSALPALFVVDEEGTLIRLLCRMNRGEFTPAPEVTPEQRLESLRRACRLSGAAGEAILRAAGEEP